MPMLQESQSANITVISIRKETKWVHALSMELLEEKAVAICGTKYQFSLCNLE